MSIKVYEYNRCGTCQKATKFLIKKGIKFQPIPIRETPPSLSELKSMLEACGDIKKLLNISGQDYRELNMKDKIKTLSNGEILTMLCQNGNLIKRPFVIGDGIAITGFCESEWENNF